MDGVNWKDAAIRAVKTFVQAALVAVPVTQVIAALEAKSLDELAALGWAAVVAGGAALVAWVWNVLLDWSR